MGVGVPTVHTPWILGFAGTEPTRRRDCVFPAATRSPAERKHGLGRPKAAARLLCASHGLGVCQSLSFPVCQTWGWGSSFLGSVGPCRSHGQCVLLPGVSEARGLTMGPGGPRQPPRSHVGRCFLRQDKGRGLWLPLPASGSMWSRPGAAWTHRSLLRDPSL